MDNILKKAKDYIAEIETTCSTQNIFSLIDDQTKIEGKNPVSFAIEITRKPRKINVHS